MAPATATPENSAAADFLQRRINYERTTAVPYRSVEFKLDRMRRLMTLLGDPQLGLKAIHIAGTKGKGSTAAMIASVLTAAGYRCGLYTSPHLEWIEERLMIDGQICPTDRFFELAAQVQPAVERLDEESAAQGLIGPTFFEVTTAMAFLHFAQAKVDAAVLEVGLGGRLDSTNVCQPEVCIITSISFDHVKQLGNTLAAIASEKAGIIKPGVPVISGVMEDEPRTVIADRAAALGAPLIQRGRDYDFELCNSPQSDLRSPISNFPVPTSPLLLPTPNSLLPARPTTALNYREPATIPAYCLPAVQLRLLGHHQAANAATAIAALRRLHSRGWSITDDAIRQGLLIASIPARIEQVANSPAIILDVAHNLASIEALLAVLQEKFSARRRIAIFASSKDKDYSGTLNLVLPAFDTIFLTQYTNNPRAVEATELLTLAQQIRFAVNGNAAPRPRLHATVRPADALRLARLVATKEDLICIAGSFFLAAELRPLL